MIYDWNEQEISVTLREACGMYFIDIEDEYDYIVIECATKAAAYKLFDLLGNGDYS